VFVAVPIRAIELMTGDAETINSLSRHLYNNLSLGRRWWGDRWLLTRCCGCSWWRRAELSQRTWCQPGGLCKPSGCCRPDPQRWIRRSQTASSCGRHRCSRTRDFEGSRTRDAHTAL